MVVVVVAVIVLILVIVSGSLVAVLDAVFVAGCSAFSSRHFHFILSFFRSRSVVSRGLGHMWLTLYL